MEEDLTDECKNLLTTLQTLEKGRWISDVDMYQYEGFWAGSKLVQGVVQCQKHFKAHDSDIILATIPKSGTTWLKALAFAVVNRFKFRDQNRHPLLATNPHGLVPFLDAKLYRFKELPDLSTFTSPRLFATHMPVGLLPESVKGSSCKIVYLCRNPKDTFVSMWYFLNKMEPKAMISNKLEKMFDLFCEGVCLCGPYWDHVLEYWNESLKNPQKLLFLKYEPVVQLKRLAEFLHCPFSPEEEAKGVVDEITRLYSFDHLSNLEVNTTGITSSGKMNNFYFQKDEVGDWVKVLTPEMVEKLDRITEQKISSSGLNFLDL